MKKQVTIEVEDDEIVIVMADRQADAVGASILSTVEMLQKRVEQMIDVSNALGRSGFISKTPQITIEEIAYCTEQAYRLQSVAIQIEKCTNDRDHPGRCDSCQGKQRCIDMLEHGPRDTSQAHWIGEACRLLGLPDDMTAEYVAGATGSFGHDQDENTSNMPHEHVETPAEKLDDIANVLFRPPASRGRRDDNEKQ